MSYDRALTVFSPDGHLFQVEYAMEAVNKGSTVVGVRGKDVVVLGVEKKNVPKLQDPRPMQKIVKLDEHIWTAFAGLTADARVLLGKARVECQSHRLTLDDPVSAEYIARYIASIQQKYTQRGGVRPFGVCTLVIGMDSDRKPRLFLTEPSGIHSEWLANAIGKNCKMVRDLLEEHWQADLDRSATIKLAIRGLMEVVQGGTSGATIEVAVMSIDPATGLERVEQLDADQIKVFVEEIERETGKSSAIVVDE